MRRNQEQIYSLFNWEGYYHLSDRSRQLQAEHRLPLLANKRNYNLLGKLNKIKLNFDHLVAVTTDRKYNYNQPV